MIKQYKNIKLTLKEKFLLYILRTDVVYRHPETNKMHRDPKDGPAMIYQSGAVFYMWEGKLHRDEKDGPALLLPDGSISYYKYGKYHRNHNNGPAIIYNDSKKVYMKNDKFHRIGGPATIDHDSQNFYVNNKNVTIEVETWLQERNLHYNNLSEEDYFAFCFFMETL